MKEKFNKKELVEKYKRVKMKQDECSTATFSYNFTERCANDTSSDSYTELSKIYIPIFTRRERRWLERNGYKI